MKKAFEAPAQGRRPKGTTGNKTARRRAQPLIATIALILAVGLNAATGCQPDTPALPTPTAESIGNQDQPRTEPAQPPLVPTTGKKTEGGSANQDMAAAEHRSRQPEAQQPSAETPSRPNKGAETAGVTPRTSENQADTLRDEPTDQPGPPGNPELIRKLVSELEPTSQECLPPAVSQGRVDTDITAISSAQHVQTLDDTAQCLTDAEIARLMILPAFSAELKLTDTQGACVEKSNSGSLVRKTLATRGVYPIYPEASYYTVAGTMLNIIQCAGKDHVAAMLEIRPGELDTLTCTMASAQEAAVWLDDLLAKREETIRRYAARADECSRETGRSRNDDATN